MLDELHCDCPYCGETLLMLVDPSAGAAEYIEDCQVCCRPIVCRLGWLDGQPNLELRRDDE